MAIQAGYLADLSSCAEIRPKFDVTTPNSVHQADLLFLPHDKLPRGRKIYKYVLTVVDVASRYKEAEPLTSKDSNEVAKAFQSIL